MSKQERASPAAVPETTAESPSGVISTSQKMLAIDVSGFTEQKNGLTYLSWAHAWACALKIDPMASFHVESWTDESGKPRCWMEVNGTAMVWVRVTIRGHSRVCMLPVMNSKNEPITIEGRTFKDKYGKEKTEKLDAFNVNTAIMRCMTKCLALFGLGLNIYAGEDLPMAVEPKAADDRPASETKPVAPKDPPQNASEPPEKHQLFADGMIQATQVCQSLAGLKSLWKSNQTSLDDLEKMAPDLFQQVKESFAAARLNMEKDNGK